MAMSDRWVAMLDYLRTHKFCTVEELMTTFEASRSTIRRDLIMLERQGLVKRIRGGVELVESSDSICYEIEQWLEINKEAKMKVAKKAATFIRDGDVVFIDSGTTCYYIIDYITAKNITVVTNGIMHINQLINKGIRTYILNGFAMPESNLVIAEDTHKKVERMNFDIAFMGTMGIHPVGGFTTSTFMDGQLKMAAIKAAEKCYVVTDHSKFNVREFYTYANFEEAPVITDQEVVFDNKALQIIYSE